MNEYVQIEFQHITAEQSSILIALLSENGFEGFEENEIGLKAFITAKEFDESCLKKITSQQRVEFNKTIIGETNWNKVWESNFNPVIADDFVAIRADFHEKIKDVKHEIIITPKMSFGTGHHATTYMMIEQMRLIDFHDKIVLDFGTGTGLLAILAEKLGARQIVAIDNDAWSIRNAEENIKMNNCSRIEIQKADLAIRNNPFDIILANITKNVILDNFSILTSQLVSGGTLLISGLLSGDENDIFRKMDEYSLHLIQTSVRNNWLCLRFSC